MPLPPDQSWFHAKTYGWGWGLPRRWQGWAVMVGYLAAITAASFLPPKGNPLLAMPIIIGLSALLVFVCWWKGDPPRWRWGKDS